MNKDPNQVIFYVYKKLEEQDSELKGINDKLNKITTEMALVKNGVYIDEKSFKKTRVKDASAGSVLGSAIMAIIFAVYEFIKAKAGS